MEHEEKNILRVSVPPPHPHPQAMAEQERRPGLGSRDKRWWTEPKGLDVKRNGARITTHNEGQT